MSLQRNTIKDTKQKQKEHQPSILDLIYLIFATGNLNILKKSMSIEIL